MKRLKKERRGNKEIFKMKLWKKVKRTNDKKKRGKILQDRQVEIRLKLRIKIKIKIELIMKTN